jgi:hypothetical protein
VKFTGTAKDWGQALSQKTNQAQQISKNGHPILS